MFQVQCARVALIVVEQGVSPISLRIFRLSGRWEVRTFSLEHFAAYWTECGIFWWGWRIGWLSLCRWTCREKSLIYCWLLFYSKQEDRIRVFFLSDFDANNSSENFKMINEEYSKMLTCIQDTAFLHRIRKARNCNAALWQTLLGRTDQDRICLKKKKNRLLKSNSRHIP